METEFPFPDVTFRIFFLNHFSQEIFSILLIFWKNQLLVLLILFISLFYFMIFALYYFFAFFEFSLLSFSKPWKQSLTMHTWGHAPASMALAYLALCHEARPHDLAPPYLALVFSEEVLRQILMFRVYFVKDSIPLYELEKERSSIRWVAVYLGKSVCLKVELIAKLIIIERGIRKFSLLFTQRIISLNRYFGVSMANLCVSRYLFWGTSESI